MYSILMPARHILNKCVRGNMFVLARARVEHARRYVVCFFCEYVCLLGGTNTTTATATKLRAVVGFGCAIRAPVCVAWLARVPSSLGRRRASEAGCSHFVGLLELTRMAKSRARERAMREFSVWRHVYLGDM